MAKVAVNSKKCTGCGTCANVCPVNVYEIKNKKSVPVREKDCIECRACEASCPSKAITVTS